MTADRAPANDRAEFYLCLARAFLAPREETAFRALADFLADDLGDLGERLGYPIAQPLDDFRAAMAAVPDRLTLLQAYSGLFLTPPAPVHINAGFYLDGAIMGASVAALEQRYRRAGVERAERMRDLSDHVSAQLEFAAYLYALEAGGAPANPAEFLRAFVSRWLPVFCADLEKAAAAIGTAAAPYRHAARILETAVQTDAAAERSAA